MKEIEYIKLNNNKNFDSMSKELINCNKKKISLYSTDLEILKKFQDSHKLSDQEKIERGDEKEALIIKDEDV